MNARIRKEIRPLIMPWCIAALAAAGYLAALGGPRFAEGEFRGFLNGLAYLGFFVGVLVLAAMPIAAELQQRTLAMLFCQPIKRAQLWKEKLVVSIIAILALSAIHAAILVPNHWISGSELLISGLFVLAAISSVGYYTLATGSLLLGVACAAGMPYAIAVCFYIMCIPILGLEDLLSQQTVEKMFIAGTIVYSGIYLYLSRRQFLQLELVGGQRSTKAAEVPAALVPRGLTKLFRSRPTGATANLIRKEVCLQKPIFLVSALFVVCWLITLLLFPLRPKWHEELTAALHALTGLQIVLMVFLSGCVAIGDDKAMGTAAWHLTLPVSALRQWFIKLLVTAGTLVAMAIGLPLLLSTLSLFQVKAGLLAVNPHNVPAWFAAGSVVFVISFWAASMSSNTVRAALGTIAALILFGGTIPLAYAIVAQVSGWRSLALTEPEYRLVGLVTVLGSIGIAVLTLTQSYREFCRVDTRLSSRVWNGAILFFAILFLTLLQIFTATLDSTKDVPPTFRVSPPHRAHQ